MTHELEKKLQQKFWNILNWTLQSSIYRQLWAIPQTCLQNSNHIYEKRRKTEKPKG